MDTSTRPRATKATVDHHGRRRVQDAMRRIFGSIHWQNESRITDSTLRAPGRHESEALVLNVEQHQCQVACGPAHKELEAARVAATPRTSSQAAPPGCRLEQ